MTAHERRAAETQFKAGKARVLLATDAAGEGLNLHQDCRLVISFELPWSPLRLEQRIGRVDRIGQTRRVHAIALLARGTAEGAVHARLIAKTAAARQSLGLIDNGARAPFRIHDVREAAGTECIRVSFCRRHAAAPARERHRPVIVRPVRQGARSSVAIYRLCVRDSTGGFLEQFLIPVQFAHNLRWRRYSNARLTAAVRESLMRHACGLNEALAGMTANRMDAVRAHHARTLSVRETREASLRDLFDREGTRTRAVIAQQPLFYRSAEETASNDRLTRLVSAVDELNSRLVRLHESRGVAADQPELVAVLTC